ncbi:hypothetical protein [Eoetvoesiella caeni]|uniref:Uncharacterized protein n=1 Tax=Eoetvoesiella caeni TaxID=645616 RepID=A0A366GY12_9BURK|nr:hypothetical protein [Eoetvoesiella caeni]MCI2811289.1 hypothetical protein [Eoetvoesiella caeni]NYT57243.1 hypothetical protein [Eoetvoesiella caeni]RBP33617.1 hypothetical protein DFR37_1268 [Eoetvoesiella caeni]
MSTHFKMYMAIGVPVALFITFFMRYLLKSIGLDVEEYQWPLEFLLGALPLILGVMGGAVFGHIAAAMTRK